MNHSPRISIITPSFNQAEFLERTILSVLNQNYSNTEYIIIDGGSTDGSVDIIRKYEKKLAYWITEKDNGLYDALNKGFKLSTGEIMCWINSDDVFFEGAFNYVAFIFSSKKEVNWLQGYPTVINEDDKIIYKRDPICNPSFFYLGLHEITNSYIQQESTFWSRKLWNNAGARINTNYSLAGDFDLWMKFFQSEKLFCSRKKLASFRKRPGQKSSNIQKYILETRQSLSQNIKKMKWLDRLFLKSIQLLLSEKKIPNTIKNILIKKAVPFVNFID